MSKKIYGATVTTPYNPAKNTPPLDTTAVEEAVKKYMEENPAASGEDGITPHIGENGNWFIGDVDTGVPSQGEAGPQGPQGEQGEPGPQGPQGAEGPQGEAGEFVLPTFDLAAMGLAAITPDGVPVLVTALDLSEMVAAMENGPVKFSFLLNIGQEITMTAVANATAIPSEGLYQWVIHGELNGTILTGYFQFAASSGTIKAWATTGSGSLLDAEGVLF